MSFDTSNLSNSERPNQNSTLKNKEGYAGRPDSFLPSIFKPFPLSEILGAIIIANRYKIYRHNAMRNKIHAWRAHSLTDKPCYIVQYTQVITTEEIRNEVDTYHGIKNIISVKSKFALSTLRKMFNKWKYYVYYLNRINPDVFIIGNEISMQIPDCDNILDSSAKPLEKSQSPPPYLYQTSLKQSSEFVTKISRVVRALKRSCFHHIVAYKDRINTLALIKAKYTINKHIKYMHLHFKCCMKSVLHKWDSLAKREKIIEMVGFVRC